MPIVSDYTALIEPRIFSGNTEPSIPSWNMHSNLGTPVFVTYSFSTEENLPSRIEIGGALTTYLFSDDEQEAIRAALAHIERKAGVTFVEVPGERAMINLAGADLTGGFAGKSGLPIVTLSQTSELNTVIDVEVADPTTDQGRETVLHEVLHALGLAHPHEGVNILAAGVDSDVNTVMSYEESGTDFTTIRPFDEEALDYFYGPKIAKKGWSWEMKDTYFEIKGASGDDWITAVNGNNKLFGRNGDDRLNGRLDNDTLTGGGGDDTLVAGRGDDLVKGNAGRDLLRGDGEGIALNGGNQAIGGDDTLKGGSGKDTAHGGGGDDVLEGGAAKDKLYGDEGADTLKGGAGDDTLDGGDWQDELLGGNGADRLLGADSADVMIGGKGADTLIGGEGFDTLTGGDGRDRFVFKSDTLGDWDQITDFDVAKDKIAFEGDAPSAAEVTFFANVNYNGVVGTLMQTNGNSGYVIHFEGLTLAEVEDNWDSFAV